MLNRLEPPPPRPLQETPAGLVVLVVDDHAAIRTGLSQLLRSCPLALSQVHAAASVHEALTLAEIAPPDLVILDIDLGGEDGLTLLPLLPPSARVLVLSSHGDLATRTRAQALGAKAFVDKQSPASVLVAHLCAIAPANSRLL